MSPQPPRPIEQSDQTTGFESGEPALDRYLTERALTNHVVDLARCYVSVDAETGRVLGYYTMSAVAVERRSLPGRLRRNAPDPVPAILLGRLAVDLEAQGLGLGRALLRAAIVSTVAAADHIGARVLLVHALHERAAAFCRAVGFVSSPTDPLHLHLTLADARNSMRRAVSQEDRD